MWNPFASFPPGQKRADAQLHIRVCKPYPLMDCNPGRWAREGIAEAILIEDRSFAMAPDIEGLVAVCQGTQCAPGAAFCRPHWGSEKMPLHPYRVETEVERYLRAGAKSISFYETAGILDQVELGRAIQRINHSEFLPSKAL